MRVREGVIGIPKDGVYAACKYWLEQDEKPSRYGIEDGRISKLELRIDDQLVCHFNRTWELVPDDPGIEMALAILIKEHN